MRTLIILIEYLLTINSRKGEIMKMKKILATAMAVAMAITMMPNLNMTVHAKVTEGNCVCGHPYNSHVDGGICSALPDWECPCDGWTPASSTHTCSSSTVTLQEGQAPTCIADGWSDYYKCSCDKYYATEQATSEITNLEEWKAGTGKLGKKGHLWSEWNSTTGTRTCQRNGCTAIDTCTHGTQTTGECNTCGKNLGSGSGTTTPTRACSRTVESGSCVYTLGLHDDDMCRWNCSAHSGIIDIEHTGSSCSYCGWTATPPHTHDWSNHNGVCADISCNAYCQHEGTTSSDAICSTCGADNPNYVDPNAPTAPTLNCTDSMHDIHIYISKVENETVYYFMYGIGFPQPAFSTCSIGDWDLPIPTNVGWYFIRYQAYGTCNNGGASNETPAETPATTPVETPTYTPDTTTATSVTVPKTNEVINITPSVKNNAFAASLDGTNLKAAIETTPFEQAAGLWVWVEVTDVAATVSAEDVKVIADSVKDATVGAYIDIDLFKQVPGQKKTQITETSAPVKLTITVPANIAAADREYAIVRVHDGVFEQITDFTQMKAGNLIEFTSDKFSTYAIIYKDATATAPVKAPKTGDTNAWFYMVMLLGAGLVLVGASRRKAIK